MDPESLELSRKPPVNHGSERLRSERSSSPNVRDCYHCANRCLDMWNDSVDHAARSWLLQMADAWLQLTSEFEELPLPREPVPRSALPTRRASLSGNVRT
jgi:hypothetical protein